MDNNNFFKIISGVFPQEIWNIISTGRPVCLSVEGNCVEGRHFIILDNGEMRIEVELPDLCQLSGVCAASVQRAVCNQRNIDLWVKC